MDPVYARGENPADFKEGCEDAPVHVPGSIQPQGVLLVLDPYSEIILQAAGDLGSFLAFNESPQGRSLLEVLGLTLGALVTNSGTVLRREPTYIGTTDGLRGASALTMTAHLVNRAAVLELEPAVAPRTAAVLLASIRSITEQIGDASTLLEAANRAAEEVCKISKYDHVMVYQFLPDGSGSVIAETRAEGVKPFLDHRFPASDIPMQARELYRRSPIRVISDVDYVARPLDPMVLPTTGDPLDMSHCALRSVAPVHIRYLKNMGVGASMSVSVLLQGELWGLIACHNRAPMPVRYEARELCKHVAQILSQKIQSLSEADEHRLSRDFGSAAERLLRELLDANEPDSVLLARCPSLQEIVGSTGIAISWKGTVTVAGRVPSASEVGSLAEWLRVRLLGGDMLTSDKLADEYPGAKRFEQEGSGLLSVLLQGDDPPLLMWFRAEQVEEISWAGDPSDPGDLDAQLGFLNPRTSFATWREIVKGRSRPWRAVEIDMVRNFSRRLAPVLQQQRVRELNVLLRRANEQLAALAATDGLTGLANRRAFDGRLEQEWAQAQRSASSLAVITLDLDFFKQYNDRFGHPDGDSCLRQVSQVIGEGRRATDLPARVGGEEFSVLLPDTDLERAFEIAEKIRSRVQALKLSHPNSPFGVVTVSLGLAARIPGAVSSVQDLVVAADAALYAAKAAGRNRTVSG